MPASFARTVAGAVAGRATSKRRHLRTRKRIRLHTRHPTRVRPIRVRQIRAQTRAQTKVPRTTRLQLRTPSQGVAAAEPRPMMAQPARVARARGTVAAAEAVVAGSAAGGVEGATTTPAIGSQPACRI